MITKSGFFEREHTADWEIEVWAPDFYGLLEQAARGMYAISGTHIQQEPRCKWEVHLTATDNESLLVRFLSELLLLSEQEQLGFDVFQFRMESEGLNVLMEGAPIHRLEKGIKAVTYHNLSIRESEDGLRVNIVFDV